MDKENNIIAQIETINDMLYEVCKELNELENIEDYEIQLQETESKWHIENKTKKEYQIICTCKRVF